MTEQLHFHFSLSCLGEENGNPLQCSCLENLRDRGAWWAAVYGVAQSRKRLKWLSSSSRPPCPSLSPKVCSNLCPLSRWCYLTISSSAALFFCLQSFPPLGSFPMSQLFESGGQSFGVSASVLPMNMQGWFPLGLTALISLLYKELSRFLSSTTVWRHQFCGAQSFLWSSSHIWLGLYGLLSAKWCLCFLNHYLPFLPTF